MNTDTGFLKEEQIIEQKINSKNPHYYGDVVRICFLIAAGLMLFSLPFFTNYIPVTIWTALLIILGLSFFSGLTNPKVLTIAIMDMIIAIGGLLLFGKYAIDAYLQYGGGNLYFWLNESLSITFLFSIYFSVKTVRGFLISRNERKVL
ncbi:hypothetical protein BH09PAT1_BH09PAT1_7200 [soil metagenome]